MLEEIVSRFIFPSFFTFCKWFSRIDVPGEKPGMVFCRHSQILVFPLKAGFRVIAIFYTLSLPALIISANSTMLFSGCSGHFHPLFIFQNLILGFCDQSLQSTKRLGRQTPPIRKRYASLRIQKQSRKQGLFLYDFKR